MEGERLNLVMWDATLSDCARDRAVSARAHTHAQTEGGSGGRGAGGGAHGCRGARFPFLLELGDVDVSEGFALAIEHASDGAR